jgi:hypothetical protein
MIMRRHARPRPSAHAADRVGVGPSALGVERMSVSSGRCLTAGSGAGVGIWVRVLKF